jgi:hypothetical protein
MFEIRLGLWACLVAVLGSGEGILNIVRCMRLGLPLVLVLPGKDKTLLH